MLKLFKKKQKADVLNTPKRKGKDRKWNNSNNTIPTVVDPPSERSQRSLQVKVNITSTPNTNIHTSTPDKLNTSLDDAKVTPINLEKKFNVNRNNIIEETIRTPKAAPTTPTRNQISGQNHINSSENSKKTKSKKWRISIISSIKKAKKSFLSGSKSHAQKSPTIPIQNQSPTRVTVFSLNDGCEVELVKKKHEIITQENEPTSHTNLCTNCSYSCYSEWNKFLSVLASPNINGITDFVFGADKCSATTLQSSSPTTACGNFTTFDTYSDPVQSISNYIETVTYTDNKVYDFKSMFPEDYESVDDGHGSAELQPPITRTTIANKREDDAVNVLDIPSDITISSVNQGGDFDKQVTMETYNEDIYNIDFTLEFLKEATQVGFILENYTITNAEEEDISAVSVNLMIKPGLTRGTKILEPLLTWTDLNRNDDIGTSINLLDIHSIDTSSPSSSDPETVPNEMEETLFTITTETGDVHTFEAPTGMERHYVVQGLKNVIAWLSYHLVLGNMTVGPHLVRNLDSVSGENSELPSLKTNVQAITHISHKVLD